VSLVLQDIEQLNEVYGKSGASTILYGSCASKIYFPGISQQTCEQLERMLGKRTILHKKEELSAWDLPTSNDIQKSQEIGRPLMTADEIRTMKDNEALFIHANKRPVKLNTLPWYNSKAMLRKAN
jgi:type IV secretory pathway TraG/TraD family ATPase VirD4